MTRKELPNTVYMSIYYYLQFCEIYYKKMLYSRVLELSFHYSERYSNTKLRNSK